MFLFRLFLLVLRFTILRFSPRPASRFNFVKLLRNQRLRALSRVSVDRRVSTAVRVLIGY